MAVLPHYSPGYPEWSIEEQPRLLDLINRLQPKMPAPVEVMDSGMLRPKKSLLAVFGITQARRPRAAADRVSPRARTVRICRVSIGARRTGGHRCQRTPSCRRSHGRRAVKRPTLRGHDSRPDGHYTREPQGPAAVERGASVAFPARRRRRRRHVPLRRDDVHEHGQGTEVRLPGDAWSAAGRLSDQGAAVRAQPKATRGTPTCAGT